MKRKVNCFCSTTFVLSLHLISWIALALHRGWCRLWRWHFYIPKLSCSSFSFCTTTVLSLRLILRNAFTLHPHYLIAFDLVNSSYTPSADGSAITGVSAVTFLHFHISTSPGRLGLQQVQALHYISTASLRLILWIVFALHPYYFTDSSAVQDQLRGVWQLWELHSSSSFSWSLANIFSPLFKITWVNKDNMTAPEDVCGSMARG